MMNKIKKPAAAVLLMTTAACTSLQPVVEPTGYIPQKAPSFVVVTTVDSEPEGPLVVQGPRVEAGSLTGTLEGERVSLPMTSIRTVSAVQPDKRKTIFAFAGGAVAVGLVTYLMVGNGKRINNSPICVPEGHRGDLPYCE